jgi:hypothetical protein
MNAWYAELTRPYLTPPNCVGASVLLIPYLLWVSFATYLNAGFYWLNRANDLQSVVRVNTHAVNAGGMFVCCIRICNMVHGQISVMEWSCKSLMGYEEI